MKKRLDITEIGDFCLLHEMGFQLWFPATDTLWDPKCGAALLNLVVPALWKEQVKFYKPFPSNRDTSHFCSFNPKDKLPLKDKGKHVEAHGPWQKVPDRQGVPFSPPLAAGMDIFCSRCNFHYFHGNHPLSGLKTGDF